MLSTPSCRRIAEHITEKDICCVFGLSLLFFLRSLGKKQAVQKERIQNEDSFPGMSQ